MAPEMFEGVSANKSPDLYAVGVIAYEVLAGRHAFNTGNLDVLVNEVLNKSADFNPTRVEFN